MRFTKGNLNTDSIVTLTHGAQTLRWPVGILLRGRKVKKPGTSTLTEEEEERLIVDPFEHINQYFAQLPLSQQDRLFSIYQAIYNVMEPEGAEGITELRMALPQLIKQIFEICTPDSVAYWVKSTPTITFPADIRVYETLEESADRGDHFGLVNRPTQATYIKKDYWGLVVLVMMLRMLVPVWGRFLDNVEDLVSNNVKEMYALRLATKSALTDTDGYKRLEEYVDMYLSQDKYKNSVIKGGVSKEDVPFRIISILTVRRLAWVDFSGRVPNFSLVGRVYSGIDQEMDSAERMYNDAVKPKVPDSGSSSSDQENRSSVSELIKIKESYTAGDLTVMESAARAADLFITRMAPDMPREILDEALKVTELLSNRPPQPAQFMIAQMVMGAECKQMDCAWETNPKLRDKWDAMFPPRALDEMFLPESLSMMGVALALLWYRGHYDVAAMMTSSILKERSSSSFSVGSHQPPAKMSKEHQDQLKTYFPYAQRPAKTPRKDDLNNPKLANIEHNAAYINIEMIREKLQEQKWVLNLPKEWINKLPNHEGGRRYYLKSDIRNKFADLAISIATRSL